MRQESGFQTEPDSLRKGSTRPPQKGERNVRLDKFLKVSRLIKRRTLAKEAADRGRILVNGKVGKAASEIVIGDTLAVLLGGRRLTVEVIETKETVRANEASSLYRVVKDERVGQKTSEHE